MQRGMCKLYLETNRNTTIQIIMQVKKSKVEYLIMPSGTKFTGSGKIGLIAIYQ